MSRLFELEVKPLSGFGFNCSVLKNAVSGMIADFYDSFTDPIYSDTISEDWFQVTENPNNSRNSVSASFYCKAFLEAEAKAILKKLCLRIAESSLETPFVGRMQMKDESNGYSWRYLAEYHNHLLSVRGMGHWDYAGNPETEDLPGACPLCGKFVAGDDYHPDNDQYICPECKQPIQLEGIWWDVNYSGNDADIIVLGDKSEHENIVDLIIPEGITYIPCCAFSGCEMLESLSFPSSLLIIDQEAFAGCTSLKEVSFPSGLVFINQDAFSECESLEKVVFQSGKVSLGSGAFTDCSSLNHVDIPYGIRTVNFSHSALESVTIPGSVENVDGWAFIDCESLKRVVIEEGVKSIGDEAFYGCVELKEIWIPASVIEISDDAFDERTWEQLTIHTVKDSYAAAWAAEKNIQTNFFD